MKTLRSKILVTLVSALFLCLSLALAFSFNIAKVHATVDSDAFVMEKGASLALTKDGLRFRVQMGQNVYDRIFTNDTDDSVDLSVLIAPKSFFEELDATENAGKYQELSKKIEIQIDDVNKVYEEDGYYYANAVLTNLAVVNSNGKITKDQFDLDFVAVGCIATTADSETTYEYASFYEEDMANNIRSQYQVAHASVLLESDEDASLASAILDRETSPYKTWFGTEEHPINVDSEEEYSILQSKVSAGLTTDAQFNVYNKFDLGERENLPENTTFYHYVSFYDEDNTTLIDTVEVKEGEAAELTKTPSREGEELLDYANGVIYKYYLSSWKSTNALGEEVISTDLTNVRANKNVYAYYGRDRIDDDLLAEANAANTDVAAFFGERFGFTLLNKYTGTGASHAYYSANKEYHPDMEYGGLKGMTSYTVNNTAGQDLRMRFDIKLNENFTYNTGDYVKFYVYSEHTTTASQARTLVRCNDENGIAVVCDNYDWSMVVFPAETFANSTYLSFGTFGTAAAGDVYKYYISNAVRVPASEVYRMDNCATSGCTHTDETVASDYTWTIGDGDVEFVGPVYRYVWGSNHSYIGEVDKHVYYVENSLVYGNMISASGSFTARAIGLSFAEKMTGKIYITAKGFESGAGIRLFTDGIESATGSNVWKTFTKVKDLNNGFAVYEYDFGDYEASYARLCGYTEYFGQVIISNISTTNPAA
ncbi:MAG: hypothetical protein E7348_01095 [Clostridiales bacterium]|nr:hypothetical protein [Clostridiales bacterium]